VTEALDRPLARGALPFPVVRRARRDHGDLLSAARVLGVPVTGHSLVTQRVRDAVQRGN